MVRIKGKCVVAVIWQHNKEKEPHWEVTAYNYGPTKRSRRTASEHPTSDGAKLIQL